MVDQKKLNELTDDELFDRLKEKQSVKSWSIGEILATEKRGFDFLSRDPQLRKELEESRDKQIETIKKSSEQVRQLLLPVDFSALNASRAVVRGLKLPPGKQLPGGWISISDPNFGKSLRSLTGSIPESVSNLKINTTESKQPLVEAIESTLEARLGEVLKANQRTNRLLERDPIFYVIAFSTIVSAVATVWMLVLTILNN